jgi:hypothetical protein
MALNYGTKWAIYMLLGKHTGAKGLQSQFATTVGKYITQGMTNQAAVVRATQEQLDPRVQAGDIGALQTLTADDLRPALGLAALYDSTQGDCPNGSGNGANKVDHQKAIANALVAMTGPVPTPQQ